MPNPASDSATVCAHSFRSVDCGMQCAVTRRTAGFLLISDSSRLRFSPSSVKPFPGNGKRFREPLRTDSGSSPLSEAGLGRHTFLCRPMFGKRAN